MVCSHDSDHYSDSYEDEEEQLSSDDEEQEDSHDYCRGSGEGGEGSGSQYLCINAGNCSIHACRIFLISFRCYY